MVVTEQINLYIAEQPEWQRKVLVRLRQLIHSVDAGIEETWRWDKPHFDHEGIMIGMCGFKEFVSIWFHKGALIKDPKKLFEAVDEEKGMRAYKIREGEAINEAAFADLVKKAVTLNAKGTKLSDAKPARKALEVPQDLELVLKHDETAWEHWSKATYSWKKDYVEWITDAKKDETRKRRIAEAFQMIREGVGRNDKHEVEH